MDSELGEYTSTNCCRRPTNVQKSENKTQHSCCKLDSYNWLEEMDSILENKPFDCVELRFKNSRKDFYRVPEGVVLQWGDIVAVEASPGHDIAVVSLSGETARLQMIKKGKSPSAEDIRKVYRKARPNDIEKWLHSRSLEQSTIVNSRRIVGKLGLDMKINDVEYQGDGTKAIFYYTAEDRVDFRQLIKMLADEFTVRIEMKQIGVRQESGRLGGLGPCGRELCCSSWMTKFKSVSTVSARTQNLSLNPQKLAGQCGKLKCCLNFEQDTYTEALETFPNTRTNLKTKEGEAFYRKMDILNGIMWYSYTNQPDNFIKLTKEDVVEIIELNRKNNLPISLESYGEMPEETIKYDQGVGQDDVSRFDDVSPRKNKNKNRSNRNSNQDRDRARFQPTNREAQTEPVKEIERKPRQDSEQENNQNPNRNQNPNKERNPNRDRNQGRNHNRNKNRSQNNNPNGNQQNTKRDPNNKPENS